MGCRSGRRTATAAGAGHQGRAHGQRHAGTAERPAGGRVGAGRGELAPAWVVVPGVPVPVLPVLPVSLIGVVVPPFGLGWLPVFEPAAWIFTRTGRLLLWMFEPISRTVPEARN